MRFPTMVAALAISGALAAGPALAQDTPPPLQAFGNLAVGKWTATDSRHVFEWGVGNKVIHSRSYFASGEDWVLASEGFWYADPSGDGVRGTVVAIKMPMDLMEYHTQVRGDVVVHRLVTHGQMAGEFRESWQFGGGRYDWTLEQDSKGAMKRIMGGAYKRAQD